MPSWSNAMMNSDGQCSGLYLGDMAIAATPHELKLACIIAGAPQFRQYDIEEQLFLRSLGGFRSYISDEELN